jgi:hypothetical protein
VNLLNFKVLLRRSLAEINFLKFEVNLNPSGAAKGRKPTRVKAEATYNVKANDGELKLKSGSDIRVRYPIRLPEDFYNSWIPIMDPLMAVAKARARLHTQPSPTFDTTIAGQAELGQQAFDMKVRLAIYELVSKLLNHRNVKPANLVWNGEVEFNIIWDGFPGRRHPRN